MARKTFLKCFRCNARCLLLLLACIPAFLLYCFYIRAKTVKTCNNQRYVLTSTNIKQ